MAHAPSLEGQSLLDAALTYASFGWSVFPCDQGKKPLTEHGLLDATRDEQQIRQWWTRYPHAAIGVNCGTSNIVVLDYDPGHDPDKTGYERFCDLVGGHETRQAQTGSGGAHLYFRSPASDAVRNSAGVLGQGIDVRGDGGYVIAPPSSNTNGLYRWLNTERLSPLPEAVIAALRDTKRAPQQERTASANTMIPEGQRHATLMSMAGTLRRKGLSPITIERALLSENEEHLATPLPEDEVLRMARDAAKYPGGDPVSAPSGHESEPLARVLDSDSVEVSVTLADMTRATFTFTNMRKTTRELNCHMSLSFYGIGYPYQQRINLDSSSGRTELRRELDKDHLKERGWGVALMTVWSLARDTFLAIDHSIAVDEIPLMEDDRYLVDPLVVAEGSTIFFGDGSSSKSYTAQALAIASVSGIPMASRFEAPRTAVMYIDYETGHTNFRRRTERICRGLGIPVVGQAHGLRYWKARGTPLFDLAESIRRSCETNGVGWVIVDSAMPACGGKVEDAESVGMLFRAIEEIGRPCLLIAHIVKANHPEATKKPFGSVYFHDLARRTWFVARSQEEESDQITTALYCKKVNDGAQPRPVGFTLHFDGDKGPVHFTTSDPSANQELAKHGSLANQLWSALAQPLTLKEIEETTGIKADTARKAMKRQPERFRETVSIGSTAVGGRPASVWSRVRTADTEENPF